MLIVADASPLISLSILGLLDSLEIVFSEVIVPEEVFREVSEPDKPFASDLKQFLNGKVFKVENKLAVQMLRKEIDPGESEAIILALEKNTSLILIDDFKGRKLAELNNLSPIGTLGVLLKLKKLSKVDKIEPLIDILVKGNIRFSEDLIAKVLKLAGES
ncbi:MAG: DUF3368 domain-containing protein [Leptospiraceae bacterium]|nr:DUF3368 domain-containing protein [Leptospiraceae bacterium]